MEINFDEIVSKDVRGEELSSEEYLCLTQDIRRWIDELNILLRNVEIQFNAHKAELTKSQIIMIQSDDKIGWLKIKGENEHWRVGANRFRASVEKRIHFAKTLRANNLSGV